MKPNIGIIVPSAKSGGVFQYALSIADGLVRHSNMFEYSLISAPQDINNLKIFFAGRPEVQIVSIPETPMSLSEKVRHFLGIMTGSDLFIFKKFGEFLKKQKIDLVIYPTPITLSVPYEVPYIASLPNLMHRYYPTFPEFGLKQSVIRDVVYGYYAKNSVLNAVDSNQEIKDLYKFLGIKRDKNRIIPYVPAGYIYDLKDMGRETADSILGKYSLPEKFLFYPASFWFHKNHHRLIKAIWLIREKYGIVIPVVLSGMIKNNYEKRYLEIAALVKKLGMEKQILFLGYVSEREIVALYKRAVALVFCSLFGPTDIPCLEAMVLGTPIVCSDIFEIPYQVGKAGIYFNPFKEEDMAEKIRQIWTDENLREKLIFNGRERAKEITLESYAKKWQAIIKEALTLNQVSNSF